MADGSKSGNSAAPILCDLDGVVWLMNEPISGSVDAIASLRRRGHRVLFVTNNSSATIGDQERKLASMGIPASDDVCTSAQAAGLLLRPGERVLVAGGPGVCEAVETAGAQIVEHDAETVIVGYHNSFDYNSMSRAAAAIRNGARLIGTNDDATYPTPNGPIPGGGAILAAIATAAEVKPIIAGKPYQPMGDYVRHVLQMDDLSTVWMVGDRDSTDGAFARSINAHYAQVKTGVGEHAESNKLPPNLIVSDLAAFARHILS
ncbi:MAG: HAD-IIA family hydrolase [Ilumatobacteraceae bacterium]